MLFSIKIVLVGLIVFVLNACGGGGGGIYYYVVTDSFPYASRCLRGAFAAEGPP